MSLHIKRRLPTRSLARYETCILFICYFLLSYTPTIHNPQSTIDKENETTDWQNEAQYEKIKKFASTYKK